MKETRGRKNAVRKKEGTHKAQTAGGVILHQPAYGGSGIRDARMGEGACGGVTDAGLR